METEHRTTNTLDITSRSTKFGTINKMRNNDTIPIWNLFGASCRKFC